MSSSNRDMTISRSLGSKFAARRNKYPCKSTRAVRSGPVSCSLIKPSPHLMTNYAILCPRLRQYFWDSKNSANLCAFMIGFWIQRLSFNFVIKFWIPSAFASAQWCDFLSCSTPSTGGMTANGRRSVSGISLATDLAVPVSFITIDAANVRDLDMSDASLKNRTFPQTHPTLLDHRSNQGYCHDHHCRTFLPTLTVRGICNLKP